MNTEAIYHHQSGAYAYINGPDTLRVRLRTGARDEVESFVRWSDRYSSGDSTVGHYYLRPATWAYPQLVSHTRLSSFVDSTLDA